MNSKKSLNKKNKKTFKEFLTDISYYFVKITGIPSVLVFLRPRRLFPDGKKRIKGGFMICANHHGIFDPIVIHTVFPSRKIYSVAAKEICNNRFKAIFFPACHCIVIDRQNFSLSAFHTVVKHLSRGKAVMIFPEGEVNRDKTTDNMQAFKSGAALMAFKSNVPIVPVYIVKRESLWHRQTVVIGSPFRVSEVAGRMPSMEDLNRVSEHLRNEELRLKEYYAKWAEERAGKQRSEKNQIQAEEKKEYEQQHF